MDQLYLYQIFLENYRHRAVFKKIIVRIWNNSNNFHQMVKYLVGRRNTIVMVHVSMEYGI